MISSDAHCAAASLKLRRYAIHQVLINGAKRVFIVWIWYLRLYCISEVTKHNTYCDLLDGRYVTIQSFHQLKTADWKTDFWDL